MREPNHALAFPATAPAPARAACPRGISPRKFDRLILGEESRVAQRLVDVLGFEIGIAGEDFFPALAGGEQPEEPCYRKSQPTDARLAGTHGGIDRDSREIHGLKIAES